MSDYVTVSLAHDLFTDTQRCTFRISYTFANYNEVWLSAKLVQGSTYYGGALKKLTQSRGMLNISLRVIVPLIEGHTYNAVVFISSSPQSSLQEHYAQVSLPNIVVGKAATTAMTTTSTKLYATPFSPSFEFIDVFDYLDVLFVENPDLSFQVRYQTLKVSDGVALMAELRLGKMVYAKSTKLLSTAHGTLQVEMQTVTKNRHLPVSGKYFLVVYTAPVGAPMIYNYFARTVRGKIRAINTPLPATTQNTESITTTSSAGTNATYGESTTQEATLELVIDTDCLLSNLTNILSEFLAVLGRNGVLRKEIVQTDIYSSCEGQTDRNPSPKDGSIGISLVLRNNTVVDKVKDLCAPATGLSVFVDGFGFAVKPKSEARPTQLPHKQTAFNNTSTDDTSTDGSGDELLDEHKASSAETVCNTGHVLLVAPRNATDIVCRFVEFDFEARLPYKTSLSIDAGVASIQTPFSKANASSTTYEAVALLATGVSNFVVHSHLEGSLPVVESPAMSSDFNAAVAVEAILRTRVIYHDDEGCLPPSKRCSGPSLSASFQFRDSAHNVYVRRKRIEIFLSRATSDILGGDDSNVWLLAGECEQSQKVCHLNLPLSQTTVLATLTTSTKFAVSCRMVNGVEIALGNVVIVPASPVVPMSVVDTFFAVLPSRALFPGDVFTVDIRSRFKTFLHTAEVQLRVGAGLRIGSVRVATEVFEHSKVDKTDNMAYIVAAGRKQQQVSVSNGTVITNELMARVTLHVDAHIATATPYVQISKLAGLTDGHRTPLQPSMVGVIQHRGGMSKTPLDSVNRMGVVHVVPDSVAGIFAFVADGKPAELINIVTLSGSKITTPIAVETISMRGRVRLLPHRLVQCESPNEQILKTSAETGCAAMLDGTEQGGSRRAIIRVSAEGYMREVPFRVHMLLPTSVSITPTRATLRPISGWYDNSDIDCQRLRYQTADLTVRASFEDGVSTSIELLDVTSVARVVSSDPSVVAVSFMRVDGYVATAKRAGSAMLSVQATVSGRFTSYGDTTMKVTNQSAANFLAVIGVDAAAISALGQMSIKEGDARYKAGTQVTIQIGAPKQRYLQYEHDTLTVVATAVLDDDSRVILSPTNGLTLESYVPNALRVSGSNVVVVRGAVKAAGHLVAVSWKPTGRCQPKTNTQLTRYGTQNLTLQVQPVTARQMLVHAQHPFLVCRGDPSAQKGANYPSVDQLQVKLVFPDKSSGDLAGDTRTTYIVSDGAPFEVSTTGRIIANQYGLTGVGTVTVHFHGQETTRNVTIRVTKFASLNLEVSPEPAYPGSNNISVYRLSSISCTQPRLFQTARIKAIMHLENAATLVIPAENLAYEVRALPHTSVSLASKPSVRVIGTGVVQPHQLGKVSLRARFGTTAMTALHNITVDDANITVASVDTLSLITKKSTLVGVRSKTHAQLHVSLTLSDGRRYPQLFGDAPLLPALIGFSSASPDKILVHPTLAVVTLLGNSHSSVGITAQSCSKDVQRTLELFSNLAPESGDADLGQYMGAPVAPQQIGSIFDVPVYVNTGGSTLKAFHIFVAFEDDDLEVVGVTPAHIQKGTLQFVHGYSSGKIDLEEKCGLAGLGKSCVTAAGTITASQVKGARIHVFTVSFRVKKSAKARSQLSGVVAEMVDTSLQSVAIGIGKDQPFNAGAIDFIIRDGTTRRTRRDSLVKVNHSRLGEAIASSLPQRKGDANCDGSFDLKDIVFVLDFVAVRGNEFVTTLGKHVLGVAHKCRQQRQLPGLDLSFMDADSNSVVDLLDVTFLMDILVGNFAFMEARTKFVHQHDECQLEIDVYIATAGGNPPADGARVMIDLALDTSVPGYADVISALMNISGALTYSKGMFRQNVSHAWLLGGDELFPS